MGHRLMGYSSDNQHVYLGDRIKVQTIRGVKGNVIGRLPDGRTLVFNRDSPYLNMLAPGQLVECDVIAVSERYIIVDPIREPELPKREEEPGIEEEPREREKHSETDKDEILEDLRRVSDEGEWELGVIAGALTYIIERLDSYPSSPENSLQDTDEMAEEPTYFFDLTQTEVREKEAPKSELL